jgi:hypothetical protein
MPLEKIETVININIPFSWQYFIGFVILAIIFSSIGYFLTLIEPIALTGWGIYLAAMLIPIVVGFDLFAMYQESHDVPKLLHPKRWQIIFITLFTGWTVIGWLVALAIAVTPGSVEVLKITYKDVK